MIPRGKFLSVGETIFSRARLELLEFTRKCSTKFDSTNLLGLECMIPCNENQTRVLAFFQTGLFTLVLLMR